ncbi:MAG: ribbon-helix-helix protein, CopG family [Mycobacteriales bacterium]
MVKTTMYISEELKHDIALLAERRGTSEAKVMRDALAKEAATLRPDWDLLPSLDLPDMQPMAHDDERFLTGFGER